ncbi:MAG: hypothetical protein U0746_14915 [Gemmataceae bacterium]
MSAKTDGIRARRRMSSQANGDAAVDVKKGYGFVPRRNGVRMQPQHSTRHKALPEPTTLRAIAFSGFVIAGTSLLFHGFSGTVDSTQADQRFQKALEGVNNPATQAMAKSLYRSIEIRDGLREHLSRRLPMSRWHGQVDQTIDFVTSILLVAGGVAILKRRPAAIPILLGYAGLSVTQKLFNAAYLGLYEIPISRTYLESLIRLYPTDTTLIRAVLDPLTTGVLYQILFIAYPAFVATAMLRSTTRSLLHPAELPPEEASATPSGADNESDAVIHTRQSAWSSFDNPAF